MESALELGKLAQILRIEQREDFALHDAWLKKSGISERKKNGITWFPLKIVETGFGLGAYPFIVVERNPGDRLDHKFQSASPVSLFTAADGHDNTSVNGTIGYVDDQRMKISFFMDDLPDWIDEGKLGVNLLFDSKTYDEMFKALNILINLEKGRLFQLRNILLGEKEAAFHTTAQVVSSKLNTSQQEAMQSILDAEDFAVVHGPPGTGKTTTLVESIGELTKREKQIMVCAPSNAATDHLAKSLAVKGIKVVRIGNLAKVETDNTALTLDVLLQKEKDFKQIRELKKRAVELRKMGGKYKRNFGREEAEQRKLIFSEARNLNKEARELESYLVSKILDEAQVIACTLIGSTSDYLEGRKFSTVVIDEAGQGIEPAVWVPILRAEKVIMAGDPFQLPPTVKSQEAARQGLTVTLLEKLIRRHPGVTLLKTQYRMHQDIMEFSNRKFYDSKLEAHSTNASWHLDFSPQVIEFIDTAGCGFEEEKGEESDSKCNPEEAKLLRKHFDQLTENNKTGFDVGIISPYRAQVEILQEEFASIPFVSVNTVDSFQGQERDVIYISLVRSNENSDIGFLRDYRRMNVAMTRARKKLIIIGDSATLGNDRFYSDFLDYIESIGAHKTAWEYLY
ncbi:MAG: DNA2/NAM7 family helicase [Flavobacteriales bacterium]|nr:DNA2/NAM7 family helicase [Flavobacteriales bacterium]